MKTKYERFLLCTDDDGNESIYDRCDEKDEPLKMIWVVSFMNEMDDHYFNQPKFAEISLMLGMFVGVVIGYVVWCI